MVEFWLKALERTIKHTKRHIKHAEAHGIGLEAMSFKARLKKAEKILSDRKGIT